MEVEQGSEHGQEDSVIVKSKRIANHVTVFALQATVAKEQHFFLTFAEGPHA